MGNALHQTRYYVYINSGNVRDPDSIVLIGLVVWFVIITRSTSVSACIYTPERGAIKYSTLRMDIIK